MKSKYWKDLLNTGFGKYTMKFDSDGNEKWNADEVEWNATVDPSSGKVVEYEVTEYKLHHTKQTDGKTEWVAMNCFRNNCDYWMQGALKNCNHQHRHHKDMPQDCNHRKGQRSEFGKYRSKLIKDGRRNKNTYGRDNLGLHKNKSFDKPGTTYGAKRHYVKNQGV